jgi:MoaA/NifB/PqqE/SkfB family radical SAM enzyme
MSSKKYNESFKDYKIRLIDPVSESFCAAKWLNATIWLGNGQTTSCHHPPGHQINADELLTNPTAIHNTQHKKLMREMMQIGKRPKECEYCWKIEDMERGAMSDRVYKTAVFDEQDIIKAAHSDWQDNTMLKTLEISFDRTCNFACSYCNPSFSTTWVKDINKYGPYKNLEGDARDHFNNAAESAKPIPDEQNPYTQAFWKWWEMPNGLADNLEEIRITGGEPLMAPGVWKLFEWFRDNQQRVLNRPDGKVMRFAINTNLVPSDDIMDRLIELSKYVPNLEIYTSCESFGNHAEYIRDGFDWNKWIHNLQRLHKEGNIKKTHMMMTINSLCLPTVVKFMDQMIVFKQLYDSMFPIMTLNILRFPSFQSCVVLPDHIREQYKNELQMWLNNQIHINLHNSKGEPLLHQMEREHIQRLIDYLDVVKTPHRYMSDINVTRRDFKQFYHQYDIRRGKNFRATFPPEFVQFYDSIDAQLPSPEQILLGSN